MKKTLKLTQPKFLAAVAAVLAAVPALAQNFNIDYGNALGGPGAGYAGAAGIPGVWNNVPNAAGFPLVNAAGALTPTIIWGAGAAFACNDPGTVGGDQSLYDDGLNFGLWPAVGNIQVGPLLAGNYEVITYAWSPCQPAWFTQVNVVGSPSLPQTLGGAWPGGHMPCITYAHHAGVMVPAGGFLNIQLAAIAGYGSLNGLQIVRR